MRTRLIFGFHAVLARLRSSPGSICEILLDESRQDVRARDLLLLAEKAGLHVLRVPAKRLDGIDGSRRHQGIVATIDIGLVHRSLDDLLDLVTGSPLLLVLDGVTDPHNLGACLRVADAAGVHAVIAPKDRAAGISAIVSKVASGAAESMPYFMVTNLSRTLSELKERDVWIVGTAEGAVQSIYQSKFTGSLALVLGAEGEGMRRLTREKCDQLVRIPMLGSVGSLNVSVASGICLFEAVRQRTSGTLPH